MEESSDLRKDQDKLSRSLQGQQSQREGRYFEDRVAELYRLLRYGVEHGRLFSGRQVDLLLTGKFGDLTLHRAIECKAGPVKAEHIDEFIAKLRLVRREYPAAQGTMVSGVSFTDAIASQAAQEGIQLTLYRDLAAQLFDGHSYARSLIAECESSERYKIPMYIEPNIGYDNLGEKIKAFEVIDQWLGDSQWNQLTLLGDVGTGKSFLSRMIAYRLAKNFLERPLDSPIPIMVDLRNADRQFSLEGLILTHLAKSGLPNVSFDVFQYTLTQGYLVLILDGFDEMSAKVTRQVTNRNFHELSRGAQGRAKILLTCRTHYFKSRTEEEEVVLGSKDDYGSETARDLYWELIARKGFRIAYLRPFEIAQIEEYVGRARPGTAREAISKIRSTYNLIELSQRPMLLEMIVKSIDKLTSSQINASTLYQVFTDAWIHRDKWRDVLSPELKLNFLTALAISLWEEDAPTIHYSRLVDYLRQELAAQVQDAQTLLEIDSEIRTASFLTRDEFGHYGLVHKSYSEFFLARHIASRLGARDIDCLATRRLSPEIISFLRYMVKLEEIEPALEAIITGDYRPRVSENALLCLYGFRRETIIGDPSHDFYTTGNHLVIYLPPSAKLGGARLEQATLEGISLNDADLSEANLAEAILTYADLRNSDLTSAQMVKADLSYSNLSQGVARSAILAGANLEGADIRNCDLRGANLADVFLSKALWDGADFRDAVFQGALLPDDLKSLLEKQSRDLPRMSEMREVAQQYWAMMSELRTYMYTAAEFASLTTGSDPDDIVSMVMIRLASHKNLDQISRLTDDGRKQFVRGVIERSARLPSYLARSFDGYDADETEDIYDLEDDELLTTPGDHDEEDRREDESLAAELDKVIVGMIQEVEINDNVSNDEYAVSDAMMEALAEPYYGIDQSAIMADINKILSPQAAEIIKDHYIQGYSVEEIAKDRSRSVRDVRRIISKSREVLRRAFSGDPRSFRPQ